jgi:hypothetical protein
MDLFHPLSSCIVVSRGTFYLVSMFQDALVSSGSLVVLCSLTTPTEVPMPSFVDTKRQVSHLSSLKKSEDPKTEKETNAPSDELQHQRSPIIEYDLPEKRVVVADMNGHSYSCEVLIHKKDDILARIACSPGFFGQAHIENLISNDGVRVTGPLNTPPVGKQCDHSRGFYTSIYQPRLYFCFTLDDSVGCEAPNKDSEVDASNFCLHDDNDLSPIQMVYRGNCNFAEKTLNQRIIRNVSYVLVDLTKLSQLADLNFRECTSGCCCNCDQHQSHGAILHGGR